MGATNITRQEELEQFYAFALPGFLDYLARHSGQMSDLEVVSSLDGITSMPAYQRLEGVEKTVLAPLNLLTKDVDSQIEATEEAIRNALEATAAAQNATEAAETAAEECHSATQSAREATTTAQTATGLATTAADKADAARVRIENIEAEANSLIEQQQSALTEIQAATAAAKSATSETLTATAAAKTATTNANAATIAANEATQAAMEAKNACDTATAEALEAIANESVRMEAETAREQAEAARTQAGARRAAQWATWFEDGTNGVKALYDTWFNSTSAAWESFNSTASTQETARQSAEEGRQSVEADRVAAELERTAAENLRKSAETDRQNAEADRVAEFESMMADCDDATKLATAAAALAVSEAKKATDAAADASAATAAAIEATSKANMATSDANTATSEANMATSNANEAASRVDDAITSAEQATLAAISATEAANAAADSVETAKTEALTAASNATTAAASATAAADSANSAAAAAIEAAERANAAAAAKQIDWTNVINKPTTLSGYGITDASIDGGTIYIGGQSITPLTEHQSLANYPTKAEVEATLTLKAAKTEVDAALAQKADTATMEAALALKATKTEVDAALALKADTSSVNSALALKSDKTEVEAALALKANKSDVYTKTESDNNYLPLSGKAVDAQHADDATHAGTADNSAKVNGLEVKTSVPANAKFTDTIYTVPTLGAVPTEDTLTWTDADNKQQEFQVGYMCRVADDTSETGYTFYQLNAIEEGKAVWSKVGTGSGDTDTGRSFGIEWSLDDTVKTINYVGDIELVEYFKKWVDESPRPCEIKKDGTDFAYLTNTPGVASNVNWQTREDGTLSHYDTSDKADYLQMVEMQNINIKFKTDNILKKMSVWFNFDKECPYGFSRWFKSEAKLFCRYIPTKNGGGYDIAKGLSRGSGWSLSMDEHLTRCKATGAGLYALTFWETTVLTWLQVAYYKTIDVDSSPRGKYFNGDGLTYQNGTLDSLVTPHGPIDGLGFRFMYMENCLEGIGNVLCAGTLVSDSKCYITKDDRVAQKAAKIEVKDADIEVKLLYAGASYTINIDHFGFPQDDKGSSSTGFINAYYWRYSGNFIFIGAYSPNTDYYGLFSRFAHKGTNEASSLRIGLCSFVKDIII